MDSVVSSSLKNLKLSSTSTQAAADEQGAKTPCNNIQRRDPVYFFGDVSNEVEIETEVDDEEIYDDDDDDDDDEVFVSEPPPKPPATKCRFCPGTHSPVDVCDGDCCLACYSKEHYDVVCPYLKNLPRYAYFNATNFEIRCRCGCPFFDKEKWVCSSQFCGNSRPVLAVKTCYTCHSLKNDHTIYDCPKNKDSASAKTRMLNYYLRKP